MLKILLAQINSRVGDVRTNLNKIQSIIDANSPTHDLIIFPELAICGYPPEDLLLFPDFLYETTQAIHQLNIPQDTKVILGCPRIEEGKLFNSLAYIEPGKIHFYDKQHLPNNSVFQESRYFQQGCGSELRFNLKGHRFAVLICEDAWHPACIKKLAQNPFDSLIVINASPYYQNKLNERLKLFELRSHHIQHCIYVNCVGGQDEIIFDGQSFCLNADQKITALAPAFQEANLSLVLEKQGFVGHISPQLEPIAEIYQALTLGLKDFMDKNQLKKIVLGLSGGIDSAVCLSIAAKTIDPKQIHALILPSPYTAQMSIDDAIQQAQNFNVSYTIIPISSHLQNLHNDLESWPISPHSLTNQNLQARLRGLILMAYANQFDAMLLATSNKSETAMGYCTLYGDMCGGYALLKDVYKTKVYELAQYINREQELIPQRVIQRPPSAELAPNQTDQDDLPDYAILDAILIELIEQKSKIQDLENKYSAKLIQKILHKIKMSEFKRFQAAPGPKITGLAFGKDWRMPISNAWKI